MKKYKVALVQMDSQGDREKNLQRAEGFLREAVGQGAAFVTFAEAFSVADSGETPPEDLYEGPSARLMTRLAKEHHVWIHCGSFYEKNLHGLRYNTSLLISPTGEVVGEYRKLHMFDAVLPDGTSAKESSRTSPGNQIVVAHTEIGSIGMSICYDLRFPELYRIMAEQGAKIFCIPAAFAKNTGKDGHWENLLRARAIENTCYVIAPAQVGAKRNGTFITYGHSMMIDPWGRILAEASGDEECILLAEMDLDYVDTVRASLPSLLNRRKDVYQLQALSANEGR